MGGEGGTTETASGLAGMRPSAATACVTSSLWYLLYSSGVTWREKLIRKRNSTSREFISVGGTPPTLA